LEKISDKELSDVDSVSASEIDSEEEDLRLTSTDEESEDDRKSRKKKKEKKVKKDTKKETKKKREKSRDREKRKKDDRRSKEGGRDGDRKRELEREIKKAERIAKKTSPDRNERRGKEDLWEHEKYDRERGDRDSRGRRHRDDDDRERSRTPTGYYGVRDYMDRRKNSPGRDDDYMDDRERDKKERKKFVDASKMRRVNQFLRQQGMRKEEVEKEMERAYTQYFSSLAKKEGPRNLPVIPSGRSEELSKEEQWERMINPHNFDGRKQNYRNANLSQHYEEDQREQLQAEIRIRERREKEAHGRSRSRSRDRRRDRDGRGDRRRERY